MQTEPFTPDEAYCVYCHAPAAGPCADCGALCCPDCVELVMRFTVRRAVCVSCLGKGRPRRHGARLWVAILLAVLLGVVAALLV